MPVYIYKAVDEHGVLVKNKIQEKSKQSLIKRLKMNGLTPIDVIQTSLGSYKRERKNTTNVDELVKIASEAESNIQSRHMRKFTAREKIRMAITQKEKITTRDIVIFTQNFYLLKKAGFNNVHALSTLVGSTENLSLKGILEDILAGVEGGDYMYATMEYYSDIFPYIYINLIKVGELSGSLEESLRQAVEYLDSSAALTKKLKSILIPNIVQFVVLLLILIVGSIYVVPIIQGVFAQVGSTDTLPAITLWFSNFLTQIQKVWYVPVIIIAAIVGTIFMRTKTPKGKYNWDYFKYRMPIFGQLIFAIDFSRLSNAMLLNLKNARCGTSSAISCTIVSRSYFIYLNTSTGLKE